MRYLKDIINTLLLALITVIFFWPAFTQPTELLSCRDLLRDSVFSSDFIHDSFQRFGEIPLWNPYILGGKPYTTDIEHAPYYLTNLMFLLSYKYYFINFILIGHVFLAGLFMYLFLLTIKVRRSSALIGAIVFMLGRNLLSLIYGGDMLPIVSYAYIPLTFLAFEKLLEKRNLKWAMLLSLILGIKFFAGRIQYFYYGSLALAIYGIIRLYQLKRESSSAFLNSLKYLAIAGIIFLGVISIQLFPLIEITPMTLQNQNSNVASYEFSIQESVPFTHFITLLIPDFFGNRYDDSYWGVPSRVIDMYIGILPLILAIIAMVFVKNRYKIPLAAISIFSVLFALGGYTPFFKILYDILPGVSLFKVPGRMLVIFTFAAAALAALGSDYLLSNKFPVEKLKKPALALLALCLTASLSVFIFKQKIITYGISLLKEYYFVKYAGTTLVKTSPFEYLLSKLPLVFNHLSSGILIFTSLLALSFFAVLLSTNIRKKNVATILLAVVIIDMLFLANSYNWNEIRASEFPGLGKSSLIIEQWDDLAKEIKQDQTTYRVMGFPLETLVKNDLQTINGADSMSLSYTGNYLSHIEELNDTNVPRLLGLMNVKYILTRNNLSHKEFEPIKEDLTYSYCRFGANKKFKLYENKAVLPRAFMVPNYKVTETEKQFEIMKNSLFNPKEEVLVNEDIDLLGGQEFKEVKINYYSPNKLQLNATNSKPGFLILGETYYPGWKAYDNGNETKVYRANYLMRMVYLPAGNHNIEMIFKPQSYNLGKYITLTTLGLIGLISIFIILLRKY